MYSHLMLQLQSECDVKLTFLVTIQDSIIFFTVFQRTGIMHLILAMRGRLLNHKHVTREVSIIHLLDGFRSDYLKQMFKHLNPKKFISR